MHDEHSQAPPDVEQIRRFVHAFYERVRADAALGPIFAARIEDWGPHLERMTSFWTAVLHGVPTFRPGPKGPPPALHRAIGELSHAHFQTWLRLFHATLHEQLDPARAEMVMRRARRIASSLSAHLPGPAPSYATEDFGGA